MKNISPTVLSCFLCLCDLGVSSVKIVHLSFLGSSV